MRSPPTILHMRLLLILFFKVMRLTIACRLQAANGAAVALRQPHAPALYGGTLPFGKGAHSGDNHVATRQPGHNACHNTRTEPLVQPHVSQGGKIFTLRRESCVSARDRARTVNLEIGRQETRDNASSCQKTLHMFGWWHEINACLST
jgi:hypothetical protein